MKAFPLNKELVKCWSFPLYFGGWGMKVKIWQKSIVKLRSFVDDTYATQQQTNASSVVNIVEYCHKVSGLNIDGNSVV